MTDPYLDHLPSHEREKIRKRLRSPEEYERLREKVKGPEDLEREMEKNAEFAEFKLKIETEPKAQEKASVMVKEAGVDAFEKKIPEALKSALKHGAFEVVVDHHGKEPRLAIKPKAKATEAPTGKIQEVFPLRTSLQQQILSSFQVK